jgi:hypothetical protein
MRQSWRSALCARASCWPPATSSAPRNPGRDYLRFNAAQSQHAKLFEFLKTELRTRA